MKPKILLVEDDGVSAAFLSASTQALPADVDIATTLADALRLAAHNDYALWLIDANLPDGSGIELLTRLRSQGLRAPALAHTASQARDDHQALIAAGHDAVLVKPLSTAALQSAIRQALGLVGEAPAAAAAAHSGASLPIWDDNVAITALNGNRAHVDALRLLCLDELPVARREVAAAVQAGDGPALHATLHKLRASCGFVGAARLEAAVLALHETPQSLEAFDRFEAAIQDTLSSR